MNWIHLQLPDDQPPWLPPINWPVVLWYVAYCAVAGWILMVGLL